MSNIALTPGVDMFDRLGPVGRALWSELSIITLLSVVVNESRRPGGPLLSLMSIIVRKSRNGQKHH